MSESTIQTHAYHIGNITFIVTPVYSTTKNETLLSILLKLMKADTDKI